MQMSEHEKETVTRRVAVHDTTVKTFACNASLNCPGRFGPLCYATRNHVCAHTGCGLTHSLGLETPVRRLYSWGINLLYKKTGDRSIHHSLMATKGPEVVHSKEPIRLLGIQTDQKGHQSLVEVSFVLWNHRLVVGKV